jgi:hypothetical protein
MVLSMRADLMSNPPIASNALTYRKVLGIVLGGSEAAVFWHMFLGSL